jgi:hypothetical protein
LIPAYQMLCCFFSVILKSPLEYSLIPLFLLLRCKNRCEPLRQRLSTCGSHLSIQAINSPSKSRLALAPMCSIRGFQLSPRW